MTQRHGYFNRRPLQRTLIVCDGYHEYPDGFGNPCKAAKHAEIPHDKMSDTCQYSKTTLDPKCSSCRWNQREAAAPGGVDWSPPI
ncbi:hypothetical protein [Cupriavidus pauculus]|uniref:hypothetical protein n=1 Tax=Cupriavidus pauculus TaxID=82633 RepID=UPI001D0C0E05|nr:hypothetical protein [Cupriavidus pauculus]